MIRAEAGELAVCRMQSVVEGVLRRVVGANDPDYDDLVQNCLEDLLISIRNGRFRGDCPIDSWVAKIARNSAIDSLRARSRDRRLFSRDENDEDSHEMPATIASPDRVLEARRHLSDLERVLRDLSPAIAIAVYLHDVLGYEIVEVSELTGASIAAARKRLVRGRREILERLTDRVISTAKHRRPSTSASAAKGRGSRNVF